MQTALSSENVSAVSVTGTQSRPAATDLPLDSSVAPIQAGPRIALLTPYTGGNFGDAAIQDSMILNLRSRLPNARFSGISLNNGNYLERHGSEAFPLCASGKSFYGMSASARVADEAWRHLEGRTAFSSARRFFRRIPGAARLMQIVRAYSDPVRDELNHCLRGYRFLCVHSLLVVCGGGQLDEEWGGAWGHPFALFKWALLAKLAGIPCVMTSVGACKLNSVFSRLFVRLALQLTQYHSYRDENSRKIATSLLNRTIDDPVIPDLAFSIPEADLPASKSVPFSVPQKTVVAISPIIYAKPGNWPTADRDLFDRYLNQMAEVISRLLEKDFSLLFVWSSTSDEALIPELLSRLDEDAKARWAAQGFVPLINGWKDLIAVLRSSDYLIASRLHSVILGSLVRIPVIAISFDSKVDHMMQDLNQTSSLLQIRNFTASEVMNTLSSQQQRRDRVVQQLSSYCQKALKKSVRQFDFLAELAVIPSR